LTVGSASVGAINPTFYVPSTIACVEIPPRERF
jgi:hypothetical protein